jgi:hypothetical protein
MGYGITPGMTEKLQGDPGGVILQGAGSSSGGI